MTLPALLALFGNAGDDLTLRRKYGATEVYEIIQDFGSGYFYSIPLTGADNEVITVGAEWIRLGPLYLHNIYKAYADNSTGVTLFGTWTQAGSNNYQVSGRLAFSGIAGDYLELITDNNVTSIGAVFRYGTSGGGLVKVTIDGDETLADLLETAQDKVNNGDFPNTILVTNGGTLNPTDRVLDTFSDEFYNGNLFSSSLSPGVHTVRLTVTGYKIEASVSANCLFHAFIVYGAGLYSPIETLFHLWPVVNLMTTEAYPTWEISHNVIPDGATNPEWIGHTNSMKFIDLPVITIDGMETSLSKGAKTTGKTIVFKMGYGARHSEVDGGATNTALVDFTWTFDSVNGMTIAHVLTWLMNGTLSLGYPGMMALNVMFDRGRGRITFVDDLDDNNNSRKCNNAGDTILMWDFDGEMGALMYVPDLEMTVNNYTDTPTFQFAIDDDSSGIWNKARLYRFGQVYNFSINEIWQSEINYRMRRFINGANVQLAPWSAL